MAVDLRRLRLDAHVADGEWYLHLFAPEQPDLNWEHPDVRAEHEDILRFWFDRGVAGVRIDSAALLVKDPELSEERPDAARASTRSPTATSCTRSTGAGARSPTAMRSRGCSSARSGCPTPSGFARYLRPDELHTAFNFDFLACPWEPGPMRASIESALAAHAPVDAPATWVLSNHDVTRPVTRYGRADTRFAFEAKREGTPTDLDRGTRRARAAALLAMALPGSMYVYQGEELGLPEVEDIPSDRRQDPMWHRSGGVDPGRDGCRVPIPWSGPSRRTASAPTRAPGSGSTSPTTGAALTVERQKRRPGSMLSLYRDGPAHPPRRRPGARDPTLRWLDRRRRARVRPRRALHLHRQLRPAAG